MLRLALISCLSALALLAGATPAIAVERIHATFLKEWSAPSYEIDQGELATFTNSDPYFPHGLSETAISGGPSFDAPIVGWKRTRLVRGAPFLTTGSYPFNCPVHPEMTATLEVTGEGDPLEPDLTPPAAGIRLQTGFLAGLVKRRTVRLLINPSEPVDVALTIRAAGVPLRKIERTYLVPGPRTLTLLVPRKAAKALKRRVVQLRRRGSRAFKLVARASLSDVAGHGATVARSRGIGLPRTPRKARPRR